MPRKKLNYRRAMWPNGQALNLENVLVHNSDRTQTANDRTFPYRDKFLRGLYHTHTVGEGFRIHVSRYAPNSNALTIPIINDRENDLGELPPPAQQEFAQGDLFIVIRSNHLIFCTSSLNESSVQHFLRSLVASATQDHEQSSFLVKPVTNNRNYRLIQERGIKQINFNSSIFRATDERVEDERNQTFRKQFMGSVVQTVITLMGIEENDIPNIDTENISVSLEIKYNNRRQTNEFATTVINDFATHVAEEEFGEDDPAFQIETRTGDKITPNQLKMSKYVNLDPFGTSVNRHHVFTEIDRYFDELRDNGTLEE